MKRELTNSFPRQHLLFQSQQWKQQNNVWIYLDFANGSDVFIVDFEQVIVG